MAAQSSLFDKPKTSSRQGSNGHKIVIIDGHALAFRSYYAIRELSNSQGQSTNAVFGFIRSLLRILAEEGEHDATVVTFDAAAKTFRHEQYKDYKAGRAPMPEDLPWQIDEIKELVRLLGLYQLEVAGLEADDLIGTIAKGCEALGYHVEIVTSDRDAYQLISDRVCVRGLDKTERLGPQEVFDKYGVTVEQWTDYRALTGDSSDNIPGARGIGPKSAQKLLASYGSLDTILAELDSVEPAAYAQKIRDSLDDVKFSRELSRIVTDADIAIDPGNWAKRAMDSEALKAKLQALEFSSIARELGLGNRPVQQYELRDWAERPEAVCVAYQISDSNPLLANLSSLAVTDGVAVAVATPQQGLDYLREQDSIAACDAKTLAVFAHKQGIKVVPGNDPLLMAYVLDPGASSPEVVARRYGDGDWTDDIAQRATLTAQLLTELPQRFASKQKQLYEDLEKPLQAVLMDMELAGVQLDTQLLKAQSEMLGQQLAELESKVRDIAENPILNLNSRDQLAELLFDKLRLQTGKKTTTGKRSTAVSTLEPLREAHPVVAMILDYRELSKLKSTYLDPLPRLVHPETGRLHTTFNQTTVATGRLSSTNPNLQNIPIRTPIGREIRRAFIAAEGKCLLVADYSQIELRVLAHVAEEPALIDAFNAGEDIHARTAAEVFKVELKAVTADMRRVAKIINFGVLYGMGAHRLTNELGISYTEAESFIDNYFAGYPKVREYIDNTLASCRKLGYVETLLGRRRLIPDIGSSNRTAREYAERTAYNMPIQGSAADIMKLAMIRLAAKLEPFDAKLLLQVHDELIIEGRLQDSTELSTLIQDSMQQAYALRVPLIAEVGVGDNWLSAK